MKARVIRAVSGGERASPLEAHLLRTSKTAADAAKQSSHETLAGVENAYRYSSLETALRGPRGSLSSRKISRKSDKSGRAVILAQDANDAKRQVLCESLLAARFAWISLADRRVSHLREEAERVSYCDEGGKKRHHTFDFMQTLVDGRKVAVAVRPEARAAKVRVIVRLIAQQAKGFADAYLVVTDSMLTREKVHNAQLILSCRADADRPADERVRSLVAGISAPVRIAQIVAASGLGGAAFRAVVRLIDLGELQLAPCSRIEWTALVTRPHTVSKEAA